MSNRDLPDGAYRNEKGQVIRGDLGFVEVKFDKEGKPILPKWAEGSTEKLSCPHCEAGYPKRNLGD